MSTWCHMFNSTLTGNTRVWFDDLPAELIDSYDDLKKVFLENYLQQKKYIKDPIELHNLKQRDGESTKDFVRRYKLESMDVKGAPECMRISEFVHGITYLKLIKRIHDKIPKTMDEIMRVTTSFLRGEVAASNHERRKSLPSPYNRINGSPGVRKLQAVSSTTHGMLKIPVEGGIITLKNSKLVPLECTLIFRPEKISQAPKLMVEERIKVAINPESLKQTKPVGMTGVPRHIAKHRLNIREGCPWLGKRKEVKKLIETRDAGATYQRLVDKAFHKQIGRNLEVYVDDLVIKSRTEDEITVEAEEALKQMKQLIAELPMLTTPMKKEELIVYLAAAKEMVKEDSPDTLIEIEEELPEPDGSGAGLILTSPEGMEFTYALRFMFDATNNEVEYEALIAGLRIAKQMGIQNLQENVDSRLVANQVNRTYVAKEVDMIHYLGKVRTLTNDFKAFSIRKVPRSENKKGPLQANYILREIHEGSCSMHAGDLVYRNNDASRAEDTGKLGSKWEGPYEVMKSLGKGAYKLRDHEGKKLLRTWNISNLKKCYVHKM
nr:reverse transcriptase domain-containing protein [Tanacetum cinerariifolium]